MAIAMMMMVMMMKGDYDDGDNGDDDYNDGDGDGDCVVDADACAASTRRCGDAPASERLARSRFHETAPLSTQGELLGGFLFTLTS